MERTKVTDLLKREDYGAKVNVKGWVRTRRGSKAVNFIALNDGSTIKNVQFVADAEKFDENVLKDIRDIAKMTSETIVLMNRTCSSGEK